MLQYKFTWMSGHRNVRGVIELYLTENYNEMFLRKDFLINGSKFNIF